MIKSFSRSLYLLLALLLLGLSACTGSTPSLVTGIGGDETETETVTRDEGLTVGTPYTRADLEAIPVANASMTSDQLRAICLSFAKMQGTIPWISSKRVVYNLSDSSGHEMVFNARTVYAGLPYTHAGSNLYTFMDHLDPETGLLDPDMTKRVGDLLGDNCCTSLFWAWSRVSSTITFTTTQGLVPKTGVIPVGPYTFDQTIDSFKDPTTKAICEANGEQTMFESYARLKVADGLVVNTQSTSAGAHHVIMCSVEPHVVRLDDGKINASESYLYVVEQGSDFTTTTLEDGRAASTNAGIDHKIPFSSLYFQGYIPFAIPELLDPSSVKKAAASLTWDEDGTITLTALGNAAVTANYSISKVNITITDENGSAQDFSFYATGVANYSIGLSARRTTIDRQLKAGSYDIEITALVGSGETVPVFSGTLVKE